jgi:hypothetical protein
LWLCVRSRRLEPSVICIQLLRRAVDSFVRSMPFSPWVESCQVKPFWFVGFALGSPRSQSTPGKLVVTARSGYLPYLRGAFLLADVPPLRQQGVFVSALRAAVFMRMEAARTKST